MCLLSRVQQNQRIVDVDAGLGGERHRNDHRRHRQPQAAQAQAHRADTVLGYGAERNCYRS